MRAVARTSDLTLLIAGLVAMMILTAVSFLATPRDAAPNHSGSSYASSPGGAKAVFVFLQQIGYDVRRSFEPFATLRPSDPSATLVLLADPLRQPSRQDRAALEAFVEAGGVILATGPSAVSFLPDLIERDGRAGSPASRRYIPTFPSPLARNAPVVEMPPTPQWIDARNRAWIPIYGNYDDPAVLTLRLGSGRIMWWASSSPISNRAIPEAGNLDLLLDAIGAPDGRTILWDEHYHGHARSFWSYAAGTPVAWGLAQVGFIASVALFTFGRRYGPLRSRPVEPRTSPLEFIDTLGALYARARPAHAAVATARARLRRVLQLRAGLGPSSSDDQLVSVLAAVRSQSGDKTGADRSRDAVRSLLERSSVAASEPALGQADALKIMTELQALAADLTAASSRPRRPHTIDASAQDRNHR